MARTNSRERPKDLKATALQFLPYLKRHALSLVLVSVLIVISAGANVYGTYLIKPLINNYILPGDLPGLALQLLKMGIMYLCGVLASLAYTRLMARTAQQIVLDLRHDLFTHTESLPLSFFDKRTHGELMSRFTNDMETISTALNSAFTALIQSAVMLVGTLAAMIILNLPLSVIVMVSFVVMFIFLGYTSKKSRIYFNRQQQGWGLLSGFIEETVQGQKVVKVFNHEEANRAEFAKRNEFLRKAAASALTYSGVMIPVVVSLSYLNFAVSACVGAFFAISGLIDLGTLASYLVYVRQAAMPVNQFSQQMNFILAAMSGAERIFEILNQKSEADEGKVTLVAGKKPDEWFWHLPDDGLIPLKGDVRLNHVTFGYRPGHPILKDVSLYAKPGEKIAFVGSTGAGKTTIVNLINRFYDVDSGEITYDGIDVRRIAKDDLRRSLAVVLQDTHLFTGTIADNIRYGNPGASFEQVCAAAELANASGFIKMLPDGYDTLLTGDNSSLSQGQQQLLAIARAAICDPPVLILDEATSSVDTRTERLIQNSMDRLMEGRTVFVIAHRLSTVANAKAIIVLEHGQIIERGGHEELIAEHGVYYRLCTGATELS